MANDLWQTPPEVFDTLNKIYNFKADMACSEKNKLCQVGFTQADDSLSFEWASKVNLGDYVWCNPPYSNPLPWVVKALEAREAGIGVVMLLNNDPSVGWYAKALEGVSEVWHIIGTFPEKGRFQSGRLAFVDLEGKPQKGNNKPQVVFVFRPILIGDTVTRYVTKQELMGEG